MEYADSKASFERQGEDFLLALSRSRSALGRRTLAAKAPLLLCAAAPLLPALAFVFVHGYRMAAAGALAATLAIGSLLACAALRPSLEETAKALDLNGEDGNKIAAALELFRDARLSGNEFARYAAACGAEALRKASLPSMEMRLPAPLAGMAAASFALAALLAAWPFAAGAPAAALDERVLPPRAQEPAASLPKALRPPERKDLARKEPGKEEAETARGEDALKRNALLSQAAPGARKGSSLSKNAAAAGNGAGNPAASAGGDGERLRKGRQSSQEIPPANKPELAANAKGSARGGESMGGENDGDASAERGFASSDLNLESGGKEPERKRQPKANAASGALKPMLSDSGKAASRELSKENGKDGKPDGTARGGPSGEKKSRGTASLLPVAPIPDSVAGRLSPGPEISVREPAPPASSAPTAAAAAELAATRACEPLLEERPGLPFATRKAIALRLLAAYESNDKGSNDDDSSR